MGKKVGDIIKFDEIKKQFTHVKVLGSGGTGDTHLLKDETTDMLFAFKKYVPKATNDIEENYLRFVDEIKILFNISHPNIVRVYNYYLYPNQKTGYLQMEYIDGDDIGEFDISLFSRKTWSDIFIETISAFQYLESRNILHRDIRSANIMIDNYGNVKVIDFGFGKILENPKQDARSVFLNWPVTLPKELDDENYNYDHQTEVYFVGQLLKDVIDENTATFDFNHILEKMIQYNPDNRYRSFQEISLDISKGILGGVDFTKNEKLKYKGFAEKLSIITKKFYDGYEPISDYKIVISNIAKLIQNSSLEDYIQDNDSIVQCFVREGDFYTDKSIEVGVALIKDFYDFLNGLSNNRKKTVLDNINTRLAAVEVETTENDLPF